MHDTLYIYFDFKAYHCTRVYVKIKYRNNISRVAVKGIVISQITPRLQNVILDEEKKEEKNIGINVKLTLVVQIRKLKGK